jgi:hypothetical protein
MEGGRMSILDDIQEAMANFNKPKPDYLIVSSNMWAILMTSDWLSRNNWINSLYGYSMIDKIRQEFLDGYLEDVRGCQT